MTLTCNCDMPMEIYADWLQDQGWEVEELRSDLEQGACVCKQIYYYLGNCQGLGSKYGGGTDTTSFVGMFGILSGVCYGDGGNFGVTSGSPNMQTGSGSADTGDAQ